MRDGISIIVSTFNSSAFIRPCLDSLAVQLHQGDEVIVVDNGSRDGTPGFIRRQYPRVTVLENEANAGAAAARNRGIERARGSWIMSLDCDVVLREDFLAAARKAAEAAAPDVGMLQPKILSADKKTVYSCGIHLTRLRRFHDIGRGRPDSGRFAAPREVFGACSAAAFYSRRMLEELKEASGYFDERFFFLVEDVDLAWRAQRYGWRARFVPEAACFHAGNSSRTPQHIRQYLCVRNRYFTITKNEPSVSLIETAYRALQYDIPRLGYLLCVNRLTVRALRESRAFSKACLSANNCSLPVDAKISSKSLHRLRS